MVINWFFSPFFFFFFFFLRLCAAIELIESSSGGFEKFVALLFLFWALLLLFLFLLLSLFSPFVLVFFFFFLVCCGFWAAPAEDYRDRKRQVATKKWRDQKLKMKTGPSRLKPAMDVEIKLFLLFLFFLVLDASSTSTGSWPHSAAAFHPIPSIPSGRNLDDDYRTHLQCPINRIILYRSSCTLRIFLPAWFSSYLPISHTD